MTPLLVVLVMVLGLSLVFRQAVDHHEWYFMVHSDSWSTQLSVQPLVIQSANFDSMPSGEYKTRPSNVEANTLELSPMQIHPTDPSFNAFPAGPVSPG